MDCPILYDALYNANIIILTGLTIFLPISAAPTELNPRLSVCTQGSISGFALIPPWAMKKCRAYGTHACIAQ